MKNDPKDPTTWTPGMVAAFNAIKPSEAADMVRRKTVHPMGCGCFGCAPPPSPERLLALEAVARAAEEHFRVDGHEGSDCYDARAFRLAREALATALSALREARR